MSLTPPFRSVVCLRLPIAGTGLPQISADKSLDLVISIIDGLRSKPQVAHGPELASLALQYLVISQTQQAVR